MKSAKWENIFKGWNQSESKTVVTLKQVPVFKDFSDKEIKKIEKKEKDYSKKTDNSLTIWNGNSHGVAISNVSEQKLLE